MQFAAPHHALSDGALTYPRDVSLPFLSSTQACRLTGLFMAVGYLICGGSGADRAYHYRLD
jgi:hypothetical protein